MMIHNTTVDAVCEVEGCGRRAKHEIWGFGLGSEAAPGEEKRMVWYVCKKHSEGGYERVWREYLVATERSEVANG